MSETDVNHIQHDDGRVELREDVAASLEASPIYNHDLAPTRIAQENLVREHVNGQVFHQRAAELSLYSHMRPVRMVHHQGGWTPELIAEVAMPALANAFTPLDSRNTHAGLPMD